jgi:hypothetical protein
MGFFKQIKDMKDMAHEAPGLIAQSGQLADAAKANAAAQSAAAAAPVMPIGAPAAPSTVGTEAIAGVDLALYATISRSFAEVGYDQARGPELAARHGVGAARWQEAVDGWNARITAEPAVAAQFNALYTGR